MVLYRDLSSDAKNLGKKIRWDHPNDDDANNWGTIMASAGALTL